MFRTKLRKSCGYFLIQNMSSVCVKNRKRDDIVVINEIEKEQKCDYLEPKRKISCLRDLDFDVLVLHV